VRLLINHPSALVDAQLVGVRSERERMQVESLGPPRHLGESGALVAGRTFRLAVPTHGRCARGAGRHSEYKVWFGGAGMGE